MSEWKPWVAAAKERSLVELSDGRRGWLTAYPIPREERRAADRKIVGRGRQRDMATVVIGNRYHRVLPETLLRVLDAEAEGVTGE